MTHTVQHDFTSSALALGMIRRVAPGRAFAPGLAVGAGARPADDVAAGQVAHPTLLGRADVLQRNLALLLLIVQDVDRLRAAARQIARHHSNLPDRRRFSESKRDRRDHPLGPLRLGISYNEGTQRDDASFLQVTCDRGWKKAARWDWRISSRILAPCEEIIACTKRKKKEK